MPRPPFHAVAPPAPFDAADPARIDRPAGAATRSRNPALRATPPLAGREGNRRAPPVPDADPRRSSPMICSRDSDKMPFGRSGAFVLSVFARAALRSAAAGLFSSVSRLLNDHIRPPGCSEDFRRESAAQGSTDAPETGARRPVTGAGAWTPADCDHGDPV